MPRSVWCWRKQRSCLPSQRVIWCRRDKFGNLVDETWTIKREALGRNARRGVWGWGCWFSLLWESVIRGVTPGRRMVNTKVFCLGKAGDWRGLTGWVRDEGWRRVSRRMARGMLSRKTCERLVDTKLSSLGEVDSATHADTNRSQQIEWRREQTLTSYLRH